MPYFEDDEAVYRYLAEEFQKWAVDDAGLARGQAADTIVQFHLREPAALITVKLKPGEAARADLGPTDLVPEIVIRTDADTMRQFCRGDLNLTAALARGQVKARGPVAKLLKLKLL